MLPGWRGSWTDVTDLSFSFLSLSLWTLPAIWHFETWNERVKGTSELYRYCSPRYFDIFHHGNSFNRVYFLNRAVYNSMVNSWQRSPHGGRSFFHGGFTVVSSTMNFFVFHLQQELNHSISIATIFLNIRVKIISRIIRKKYYIYVQRKTSCDRSCAYLKALSRRNTLHSSKNKTISNIARF